MLLHPKPLQYQFSRKPPKASEPERKILGPRLGSLTFAIRVALSGELRVGELAKCSPNAQQDPPKQVRIRISPKPDHLTSSPDRFEGLFWGIVLGRRVEGAG